MAKFYKISERRGKVVVSAMVGIGLNNFSVQLAVSDNRDEAMVMAINVIGEAIRRFSVIGKEIAKEIKEPVDENNGGRQ